jgi:hypothetical protein
MTRQTSYLTGGAALAIVAWFLLSPGGGERVSTNLVDELPNAAERRPAPEVFSAVDTTIGGVSKRAIVVREAGGAEGVGPAGSRLQYTVTVPEDGELRFSLGIQESEWTKPGDGVLFRVLVGAGTAPEEVLNVQLNPYANPGDRTWHDMSVDLAEYSGETIDLFFNTNSSPPSRPQKDDRIGDIALWGNPRVVAR